MMLWECVLSVIPTNKCHILLSYVYFSIWDIYTFKTNQTPRSALLSSYCRTRFKLSHLFHSVPVCQVNASDLKHNKVLTYDHQNYFHCKLFFNYPVTQVEEAHSIHSATRAGVSSQTSFRCRSTCGPSGSSGRRSSSHTCRTWTVSLRCVSAGGLSDCCPGWSCVRRCRSWTASPPCGYAGVGSDCPCCWNISHTCRSWTASLLCGPPSKREKTVK